MLTVALASTRTHPTDFLLRVKRYGDHGTYALEHDAG